MKANKELESKENNKYINSKILINIFCFQEFIYQRIKKPQKENKNLKIMKEGIIFLKKKFMQKYKDLFNYKKLIKEIKKKKFSIIKSN